MTRLVIDARLASHSGIGTYLAEMLPRVVPGLAAWQPTVLCGAAQFKNLTALLARDADVVSWNVAPLSVTDLLSVAPATGPRDLLWTPHFNVPLRGRGALAVTLHDLLPLTVPALAGYGRSLPLHAWLRAIRGRARAVFCVSEYTRGEALRHAALDPGLVHVTPLGVDRAWHAAGAEPASSYTESKTPTMIFVGLLKPHKNVSRLLRAFIRVRGRISHRLVLVARHHDIRNVDREALTLAAEHADRVELVADLPFAELVARVASAQFAVQPSLHEGFGLPAIEAMAAGVPVLASRAGALPEVCGNAALYCDPLSVDSIADSLLLLASDPELRRRLAAAGRARSRSFTWDACAATTTIELTRALRQLHETPK